MFYIDSYLEKHQKIACLISISCLVILKELSDPSSKLFGALGDAFP